MAKEFAYVDVLGTDPDAGRSALNAASADGWEFCFTEFMSAHTRVWLTREAVTEPADEPTAEAAEAEPEEEHHSRRRRA